MPALARQITPFLWFDHNAEAAVANYVTIFPNSKVKATTKYSKEAAQASGRPEGSLMTIAFELDGQDFTAINGGPAFKFNESVSFVIHCRNQKEIDYYWNKLSQGGVEQAQMCGWLKDRYGLSWQVVPDRLNQLMSAPGKSGRVMAAILKMKKIDLATLEQAAG